MYRFVIPASQRPAHHAAAPHAEQVIDRVERQDQRRGQRHRRVLNGIVQHSHKIGIRQIVKHRHQRA